MQLSYYGATDVDRVLDAMEYAIHVHDIEHVVIDNLQFMLSDHSTARRGFDRLDLQDAAIAKFRQFATTHNVHVTLVIHPRKEAHGQSLSLSSVFGTAKATQEADNVLILQDADGVRSPDPPCYGVTLNRSTIVHELFGSMLFALLCPVPPG